MTEMSGALDGLGLPAIVRFLTGLRKTGWLRVVHDDWRGELFFEDGRVVSAALGSRKGISAIEALVQSLPEGQFTFTSAGPDTLPPDDRNVDLTSEQLQARLDDLAARAARGAPSLPSLLAVPVLVAHEETPDAADQLRLDRGTLQTLLAVDGHRTVRDIVSARSSFEALWQLAALANMGVVRLSGPEEQSARAVGAASVLEPVSASPAARPVRSLFPTTLPTAGNEPASGVRCPMLGFEDDPKRAFGRPTRLHRCFALGEPLSLPLDHQRELCLTPHYETCPRLAPTAEVEAASPEPNADVVPAAPEPMTPVAREPIAPPEPTTPAAREPTGPPAPEMTPDLRQNIKARLPAIGFGVLVAAVVGLLLVPRLLDSTDEAPPPGLVPTSGVSVVGGGAPPPAAAQTPSSSQGAPGAGPARAPQASNAQPPAGPGPGATAASGQPAANAQPGGSGQPAATSQPAGSGQPAASGQSAASAQSTSAAQQPAAAQPPGAAQPPTGPSGVTAASAADTSAGAGRVVFDERFADNQRGWLDNPSGPAALGSGGYLLTARQPGQFVALGVPLTEALRDVVVSASFHKVAGPAGGGFGLIVRDQGPDARDGQSQAGRYYVFEVGDKGEVGIWRRETDHWVDLLPWQPSDAVHAGTAPNEMVVRAVGSQLALAVNGQEVGNLVDNTLGGGRLGLFVGGDLNQIAVDHYWVQNP